MHCTVVMVSCQLLCPHLHTISDPTGALLAVTTRKLISNLRNPHRSNFDLTELVAILVHREHHLIDDSGLTGTQECASITL